MSSRLTRRGLLSCLPAALAPAVLTADAGPQTAERPRAENPAPPLPPALPADVFRERQDRLRAAARREGLAALLVVPSTNLQYVANLDTGRSERLMALLLLADGRSVFVSPAFEAERVRRDAVAGEILTWEEHEDPVALAAKVLGKGKRVGVEGATDYHSVARLQEVAGARTTDATRLFDSLRSVKTDAERALIRDAAGRTETAIAATQRQLAEGMTERDAAQILEKEFRSLGVRGGGLVQFGASAALPHGGPGSSGLKKGDLVLIDCGCRVRGYSSDVTRTAAFGAPTDEQRKVYAAVLAAQRAGLAAFRAGAVPEDVDRAARKVIEDAGHAPHFTHRLGHGLGMDGHEHPYLVRGNKVPLVAGNVCTIEPGIYVPGKLGVRIEDDYAATEGGADALSAGGAELVVIG